MAGQAPVCQLPLRVQIHIVGGSARCRLAVVQGSDRSVREPDHHEPPTSDVAGRRTHHGQCESDRHRRVHRATALPEDDGPHLTGRGMSRRHHGVWREGLCDIGE